MTPEELKHLKERYTEPEIPPCHICGSKLSIQAMGGGEPTNWACSPREEDPDDPEKMRYKEGRGFADQHFSDSYHIQRRHGDERVLKLIRAYLEAEQALKGGE